MTTLLQTLWMFCQALAILAGAADPFARYDNT